MTRDEFKKITKAMLSTYQNTPVSTPQVFDLWYELLKDMSYKAVSDNLQQHIKTNKYAPTVAELRGAVDTKDLNNFKRRNYNMDTLEAKLLAAEHRAISEIDSVPRLGQITGGD